MNDELGAFITHDEVSLPGAAAGPLAGLAFAAKDLYDVAGHITGCGSPDWLRTHAPAATTAPAVQALLDAGAALAGKTVTDEMAFSLAGENAHYGTPVNVNAPGRVAGGSSSGSAAAVAGGLVDFALGSDTGGSVRVPASFCGLYGLRPSHGRVSLEGVNPLAPSFDTVGWFARDSTIFARVGAVLIGGEAAAANRLLVAEDAFALAGAAIAAALGPALDRLAALLGPTAEVSVSGDGLGTLRDWLGHFRTLQLAEVWRCHGAWVTAAKPRLGPGVRERFAMAAEVGPDAVAAAAAARERITDHMAALLAGGAVLALPSARGIAPRRGAPAAELEDIRVSTLGLTCIAGLARLPQVSLPVAKVDGCPVGLGLIAAAGLDETLIDIATRLNP
ncbi:MAG: amidase [Alphaproteobacteria bacterium]